jgi:hypothetical protein
LVVMRRYCAIGSSSHDCCVRGSVGRRVMVMEIGWRNEFKRVFKTRKRSGEEKRKGKESSMEVENGGVSLVPQKYILALAPFHAASGQKKYCDIARLMRYFSPPLPSVLRGGGKAAASLAQPANCSDDQQSDSDFPTKRQPVNHQRVGLNSTVLYPRLQPYFTAICSLPKFLIEGEEAEMISTPPFTSTPPSPSP